MSNSLGFKSSVCNLQRCSNCVADLFVDGRLKSARLGSLGSQVLFKTVHLSLAFSSMWSPSLPPFLYFPLSLSLSAFSLLHHLCTWNKGLPDDRATGQKPSKPRRHLEGDVLRTLCGELALCEKWIFFGLRHRYSEVVHFRSCFNYSHTSLKTVTLPVDASKEARTLQFIYTRVCILSLRGLGCCTGSVSWRRAGAAPWRGRVGCSLRRLLLLWA